MRNLIAGLVLGLALGVLGTLGVQYVHEERGRLEAERTVDVFDVIPIVMDRALPGVRVLDVALETPSRQRQTHREGDEVFDADITYQLDGKIKRVVLPFGYTDHPGTLIFPSTTEVVVADDKAEVIETLESESSETN